MSAYISLLNELESSVPRAILFTFLTVAGCTGEPAVDSESGGASTTTAASTSSGTDTPTVGAASSETTSVDSTSTSSDVPTTGSGDPTTGEDPTAGDTTVGASISATATDTTTTSDTTTTGDDTTTTGDDTTTTGDTTTTTGDDTTTTGDTTTTSDSDTTGEPFDPLCGNGELDPGETCDDGAHEPADACSATCHAQKILSVTVGQAHTCALLSEGAVKCWGTSGWGALGLGEKKSYGFKPGEMGDALPFVDLGAPAVDLVAGDNFTCARLVDGRVKCWGDGSLGRLGLGNTEARGDMPGEMGDALPAVDIAQGLAVVQLALGYSQTCALLADGRIKCWGTGPLGIGDKSSHGAQPGQMGANLPFVALGAGLAAAQVGTGLEHTCALLTDGRVKCWGTSPEGQLGHGDTLSYGDMPGQMGDVLPFVALGAGVKVSALSVGYHHTCVRMTDGRVKCWGSNASGQLGLGDKEHRGDQPGEMGDALPYVDLGTGRTAVEIRAMHDTTCALLDDGGLKCWGLGFYGVPGLGNMNSVGTTPGTMGDALPPIDFGQGLAPAKLAAGGSTSNHQCVLLVDGRLKCWGRNHIGYLGLGDGKTRGDNPGEMGDALPTVKLFNPQW